MACIKGRRQETDIWKREHGTSPKIHSAGRTPPFPPLSSVPSLTGATTRDRTGGLSRRMRRLRSSEPGLFPQPVRAVSLGSAASVAEHGCVYPSSGLAGVAEGGDRLPRSGFPWG